MENKENYQTKEVQEENPLIQAYLLIHGESPQNLEEWQIAQKIVEVLDDQNWISSDLAKECVYRIIHIISYPDIETSKNIILMAEEKAKGVFPELSKVDEVHMDQVEYVYNKWKKSASTKSRTD
jgi:hypothetical protein